MTKKPTNHFTAAIRRALWNKYSSKNSFDAEFEKIGPREFAITINEEYSDYRPIDTDVTVTVIKPKVVEIVTVETYTITEETAKDANARIKLFQEDIERLNASLETDEESGEFVIKVTVSTTKTVTLESPEDILDEVEDAMDATFSDLSNFTNLCIGQIEERDHISDEEAAQNSDYFDQSDEDEEEEDETEEDKAEISGC